MGLNTSTSLMFKVTVSDGHSVEECKSVLDEWLPEASSVGYFWYGSVHKVEETDIFVMCYLDITECSTSDVIDDIEEEFSFVTDVVTMK